MEENKQFLLLLPDVSSSIGVRVCLGVLHQQLSVLVYRTTSTKGALNTRLVDKCKSMQTCTAFTAYGRF